MYDALNMEVVHPKSNFVELASVKIRARTWTNCLVGSYDAYTISLRKGTKELESISVCTQLGHREWLPQLIGKLNNIQAGDKADLSRLETCTIKWKDVWMCQSRPVHKIKPPTG
jgi:hypothetical protein